MLLNILMFQLGWFSCVLCAAAGHPWIGVGIAALIVFVHLWRAPRPLAEFGLVLTALVIGTAWDSLMVYGEWLRYEHGIWQAPLAPNFIIAMWALFATTLNVSLAWFKGRWILAAVSGAVAGPLAYHAGQSLGAVTFGDPLVTTLVLALGWAGLLPSLLWIAARLDGIHHTARAPA